MISPDPTEGPYEEILRIVLDWSGCPRAALQLRDDRGLLSVVRSLGLSREALSGLEALSRPFPLNADTAHISGSVGVAYFPDDATTLDDLLKSADQAMYHAKKKGRNRREYFTPAMQAAARDRRKLVNELRRALEQEEFEMHYQPIVSLESREVFKGEALIRWHHPSGKLVLPGEFLPVAEETGLVNSIGEWVFREVSRQVAQWNALYDHPLQISINLSAKQILDDGFRVQHWLCELKRQGLTSQHILLEIPEHLLLAPSATLSRHLLALRQGGIRLSLDDFGTGYTSLTRFKEYDIDFLKLDRTLTGKLRACSDEMVLCEAIIALAHKLGVRVIAEGVETRSEQDLLTSAGCDYGQGYLFSKALPAGEFASLVMGPAH